MSLLAVRGVSVRRGSSTLLDGVSFEVGAGDFVAIVGPNGGGKTSLLRAAVGLLPVDQGSVTLDARPLHAWRVRERAQRVAWLPQQALLSEPVAVDDVIAAARFRFDESPARASAVARRVLAEVGAAALQGRRVDTLSGGEQQRVALAALIAQDTPLVLLDEPANHLDPAQQAATYRWLGSLWHRGLAIVCVTHDINLLRYLGANAAPRVIGVAAASVQFDLAYDSGQLQGALSRLFDVTVDRIPLSKGPPLFVVSTDSTPEESL